MEVILQVVRELPQFASYLQDYHFLTIGGRGRGGGCVFSISPSVKHCNFYFFVIFGLAPALIKPFAFSCCCKEDSYSVKFNRAQKYANFLVFFVCLCLPNNNIYLPIAELCDWRFEHMIAFYEIMYELYIMNS